jgi:hypothetical protein
MFFIGYWILKRGWIFILAPFFINYENGYTPVPLLLYR